jgi:hypothetical protein
MYKQPGVCLAPRRSSYSTPVADQIYPFIVMAAPDSPQVVAASGLIPDDRTAPSQTKRALEPLLGGEAAEVAEHIKPKTVLGLRRRSFFICLAILCLVVGATVGGSVGGALAVQQSR